MPQRAKDEPQAFSDRFWASGQVDDQRIPPDDADAAAKHGPVRHLGRAHADILRNAGHIPLRNCPGGFRRAVPGGEPRPAAGDDKICSPVVRQTAKLFFQHLRLIGKQNGLDDRIAGLREDARCLWPALIRALPFIALIAQGDDGRGKWSVRIRQPDRHAVSRLHDAACEHLGEHALPRHDAVPGALPDRAAAVAFLADLRDPQGHLPRIQQGTDGQGPEVDPLHQHVLPEVAVRDGSSPFIEGLHLVRAEQADLPVPVSGVGVPFYPVSGDKHALFHGPFRRSPFQADADRLYFSLQTHLLHSPSLSRCAFGLTNSPLLPPLFLTSMICPISIVLSMALHMS